MIEQVGHEDRSGISWPVPLPSEVEPFGEDDFSLFAVWRTSRALAAATALGPCDVEAATLVDPT